jgi:hypothetical protein
MQARMITLSFDLKGDAFIVGGLGSDTTYGGLDFDT